MPGIDGWETIRRLRGLGHTMPLAVVSANAFDKRLENDVGLASEDFIVKPVRVAELLDWLGLQLGLKWTRAEPARKPLYAAAGEIAAPLRWPSAAVLEPLHEAVKLGHVRGVNREIEIIAGGDPAYQPFVAQMRALAGQFHFETMNQILAKASHEPRTS